MAAPAILSQGTTVSIDDVGGSDPTIIEGVRTLENFNGQDAAWIDTTVLADTAKTGRMGLPDFGQFTMGLMFNLDDDGQAAMDAAMRGQTPKKLVITLPATDPTVTKNVWTATVYILKMEASVSVDNVVTGSATIRVSGAPVWS